VAIDLDRLAGVLAEEHAVAHLQFQRAHGSIAVHLAATYRQHLALLGLFGRRIRDHDAGRGSTLLFDSLHDNPVVKGTDLHDSISSVLIIRKVKAGALAATQPHGGRRAPAEWGAA